MSSGVGWLAYVLAAYACCLLFRQARIWRWSGRARNPFGVCLVIQFDASTGDLNLVNVDLNGASGTFSGELSAATGTFAGALRAASGTLGRLTIASGDEAVERAIPALAGVPLQARKIP